MATIDGGRADAAARDANPAPIAAEDAAVQPEAGERADTGARDPAPEGCDLTGRWLITEHLGTDVLGAIQVAQSWFYVELSQSGSAVTFDVSVGCGADLNEAAGQFDAKADDSAAWPAYMVQHSYAGRKATVTATADGCQADFDKATVVRGATTSVYEDMSVPLPKLAQKASDGNPGWEDWDEDDLPGVTLNVGGLASGALYVASRTAIAYSGTFAKDATLIRLNIDWEQERETLGSTPDPLGILRSVPAQASDPNQQLVELAKLSEEQAAGDDATRCARLRSLAPMLTPNASRL